MAVHEDRRCYVYGIVREADAEPPLALMGVDGESVTAVPGGGLAAIVSPLMDGELRMARTDVLAHSEVVQALFADRDVIPVRLGSVYESPTQVKAQLLERNRRALGELLDDLAGMVEVQVKATYVEEAIVAEIVSRDRRLRRLREASRAGQDYAARVELGRRFATVLDARREQDSREMRRALGRFAAPVEPSPPTVDFALATMAFLVSRSKLDDFDGAVQRFVADSAGRITVRCVGPVAPYSFVGAALPGVG
jgi:hypothetical protein